MSRSQVAAHDEASAQQSAGIGDQSDKRQVHRLKTLALKERPLAPHALAWSCDAELAVATTEAVFVFLPEYPSSATGDASRVVDDALMYHHQFASYLQLEGVFRPDPVVNERLCETAGVTRVPPIYVLGELWRHSEAEVPGRDVTGKGGAVSHVIGVAWSPPGLGANLRPVLTIMMTTGAVLAVGEVLDSSTAAGAGLRTRNTKLWRVLWGLGAGLPIPDEREEGAYRTMEERITSFSWAGEVAIGRGFLAYATDEQDVVIMSVQRLVRSKPNTADTEDVWQVREAARFDARSPHEPSDEMDPDFVPTGTAFSVSWSPWTSEGTSKTAIIAYIAHNYVGFRKVSLKGPWEKGGLPTLEVAPSNTTSICIRLSTEAFVKWEDMVWIEDQQHLSRGFICTPFEARAFQVNLTGDIIPPVRPHSLDECGTRWAPTSILNPIADLIIHPPDPTHKPKIPLYTFVRSSATWDNQNWYDTNTVTQEGHFPQWAEYLRRATGRLIPLENAAAETVDSDSDDSSISDDDFDIEAVEPPLIHPYQFRIWGLAISPGGGSTAALITRSSTQYPDRKGRSKLFFGWARAPVADGSKEGQEQIIQQQKKLTTEARLWEWMYGGGPDVIGSVDNVDPSLSHRQPALSEFFRDLKATQKCAFCENTLVNNGYEAKCGSGHSFAICSYSGVAVLAPGVSHVCAVCQRRCLKYSELVRLAKEYLGPERAASIPPAGEACGACGGKFVA